MALTETDKKTIARARELAVLRPGADPAELADVLGSAQYLLLELAAIAERLDEGSQP